MILIGQIEGKMERKTTHNLYIELKVDSRTVFRCYSKETKFIKRYKLQETVDHPQCSEMIHHKKTKIYMNKCIGSNIETIIHKYI